jgi:hypothetical protein
MRMIVTIINSLFAALAFGREGYYAVHSDDADLSRCAWESLKVFLQEAVPENDPIPGAVIAVQTFGDFLGFNPHAHILVTDGCFYGDGGMFRIAPPLELKKLETIFRHKIFRMLLNKGKITEEMIRMLSAWKHSGFNVFCGNRISPNDNLPRTYAVFGSGGEGHLYGQGQKEKHGFPRPGMDGRDACPSGYGTNIFRHNALRIRRISGANLRR